MPETAGANQLEHRGVRAVQRLVEYAPASGNLALWVRHHDVAEGVRFGPPRADEGEAAPVFTDGLALHYRPGFERLPVEQQAGWVAHQVLHIALRHVQRHAELVRRIGDVDLQLFNHCADAIVNSALAHLTWLELPPGAVLLETVLAEVLAWDQSRDTGLMEWDVERLYRAVDDRRAAAMSRRSRSGRGASSQGASGDEGRPGEQGGGHGGRSGNEAPDDQAAADSSPQPAPTPRVDGPRAARLRQLGSEAAPDLLPDPRALGDPGLEAEASREWAERLQRAQAGDGPLSLVRLLLADLPRVRTPWEQVLRTRLARGLSRRPDLSWSRPSRSYLANQGRSGPHHRLPWEPGRTGSRSVPRLALVVDVSGSIDDGLLARFTREVEAIVRRQESALVLVVGDCAVQRVEHYQPGHAALQGLQVGGGGGTDFSPLLAEAERHRPDLIVVLTDLDGPALHRPACPVLWAVPPSHARAGEPFGTKLVLS